MFDIDKLKQNRKKSVSFINNSIFHQFLVNDIIDRLQPINKNFNKILILNSPISNKVAKSMYDNFKVTDIEFCAEEELHKLDNQFDLIIFPFGFHWVNEVQKALYYFKLKLKNDGILFCNFPGAGTLKKLRSRIVELESINGNIYNTHISPFINFDQVTPLLQQAGFVENIIDMENLELEYKTPWHLMKAIKNSGESNILKSSGKYSINKKIYSGLKKEGESLFVDKVNLITFISSLHKNSIKLKPDHYDLLL